MEVKVTVNELVAAHNALSEIGKEHIKDLKVSIRVAQNLRVLIREVRITDALRKDIVDSFEHVELRSFGEGLQQYVAIPSGWDREDGAENSHELLTQQVEIMKNFRMALNELGETEVEFEIRGLLADRDLVALEASPLNLARCAWLITGFDDDAKDSPKKAKRKSSRDED